MFFKMIFLKKFANFIEKHGVGVFFNKIVRSSELQLLKVRLQHRFFPAKFVAVAYDSFRFPACNFIKKRLRQKETPDVFL